MYITWEDRKNYGKIDSYRITEKPQLSFTYAWILLTDTTAQYVESHEAGYYNKDMTPAMTAEVMAYYNAWTPPDPGPVIPPIGILETDVWEIPADSETTATVTYTSDSTVYFIVNNEVHTIEPIDYVATLEIAADAAGPIRVEVRDKQLMITATEVAA